MTLEHAGHRRHGSRSTTTSMEKTSKGGESQQVRDFRVRCNRPGDGLGQDMDLGSTADAEAQMTSTCGTMRERSRGYSP